MRINRLFVRALGVALFGLAGCARPAKQPHYRIGFSQCSMGGPWRRAMLAGMERGLSFHPEAELRMLDAHDNSERQQQQIRELVRDSIDLLIVSPYEAAPVTPAVEEAYRRGIPVVLLDRRTASAQYTAFVGGDNEGVGRTAARYAARLLHQQGSIIELLGSPGSSAASERELGFAQGLAAYSNLKVVSRIVGFWIDRRAKPPLRAALLAHPEVSLIFAHNDGMGRAAAEVCRELGRERQVRIVGVDGLAGEREGLDLVRQGQLRASLLYPPGGEEAIRTALQILHHTPYQRENVLGTMVIDSTNVVTMQQQTNQMMSQQRDIEQQRALLQRLAATYASQQLRFYGLLASLLGALALGAVAWRSARRNRLINRQLAAQNAENDKINRQLLHQNEEISSQRNQLAQLAEQARTDTEAKLRFFTNLSHELRTPLTLIAGPVEELLGSGELSSAQRHDLGLVRRSTQRLLQLVNQLLDFRKIEVGKMAVQATEGNLVAFVRELVDVFEQPARQRGVQLRLLAAEAVLSAWFDGNVLDKVFTNLLSNALKFTPAGGSITVRVQAAGPGGQHVQVSVADSGRGISERDRPHIFEWFYQGERVAGTKGSGMGLALAQGLVRLHQGQLALSSEPGRGSTFTVTLPRELPAPLRATEAAAPPAFALDELALPPAPPEAADAPEVASDTLVLVIEDHPDVNDFLARKLRPSYRVETAADGLTGLRLATELLPDLVVCDVMMPGLSGLEVVARLRADWRTSHIPVVLLTARGAAEEQLEGVQAGADVYLTKPFNPSFLLESVRTLLTNRARQREHFRRQLAVDEATHAPTSPDQQFVADLTAVVEAGLTKTDLSVEEVAGQLGLSRMQLYRKVKAVLGTGVTDFIQSLRLTKARELLLDGRLSVADVAYQLGFSSRSYFSASFRSRYQVSPSEFRARQATAATP